MPEPSLYNPLGMPFIELPIVDSTNNYALTLVHAGLAQHGAVFFAHEQTAGKGQRGKTWTTQKDANLIISIVINTQALQLSQQFQLSACIAVSTIEFFKRYAGSDTYIKWPNDLYWRDRKAGGILIENIIGGMGSDPDSYRDRGQKPDGNSRWNRHRIQKVEDAETSVNELPTANWLWAVAGIGININQASFPDELKNPVSLKQITGKNFDPVILAKELCSVLEKNFNQLVINGFEDIYTTYLSSLYKRNQLVRLKKESRVFEATIKSVLPTGELVVQHAIEETFTFGEIEWVITAD